MKMTRCGIIIFLLASLLLSGYGVPHAGAEHIGDLCWDLTIEGRDPTHHLRTGVFQTGEGHFILNGVLRTSPEARRISAVSVSGTPVFGHLELLASGLLGTLLISDSASPAGQDIAANEIGHINLDLGLSGTYRAITNLRSASAGDMDLKRGTMVPATCR